MNTHMVTRICFCITSVVLGMFDQGSKVKAILEGHLGNVNCAEFCPHYTSTLVSASDDRTFRVHKYYTTV